MFLREIGWVLATCLLLSLVSCQPETKPQTERWREEHINGRQHDPIYTVRVPPTWERLESVYGSLEDTRLPLVTFLYSDQGQTFTVTVHNFPAETTADQIPPLAQVERWKKQFEFLEPRETELKQVAFAGYTGYFFKGVGELKGGQMMMLAWSLQLPHEQLMAMSISDDPLLANLFAQMRADVTVKVVGPVGIVSKHREEIQKFVDSFHMIREIPSS